jgi:GTP diphosphokinase / guanosine-3',5'-bis(diphosphate) 3'-diphosphatase
LLKAKEEDRSILAPLLEDLDRVGVDLDQKIVRDAFDLASEAHATQRRRSGEPYVTHPVAVARILVELLEKRTDSVILAAALLHDVVEDTGSRLDDLTRRFGAEVATLVDGVTKIEGLQFSSTEAEQVENFRKMLLSMAMDVRVILIKLADRLHNMRTLDHLPRDRQEAIARETRDIYAPLAHRLGIGRIKWELEDLALKYLDLKAYRELARLVTEKRTEREAVVEEVLAPLKEVLAAEGLEAEISGRPKHFDSIYRKMKQQNRPLDAIYDLIGVRIITTSKASCYQALGVVHDLYKPVPERFKDYIATPKTNLYQSLHTTVIGPGGRFVEVQIRTQEMHRIAEFGIAAHYSYKEGRAPERELDEKLGGLVGGTLEWTDGADPEEYMDFLRTSLYQDEVFVFTPKGDLRQLPKGATVLDFAFLIHTQVGMHTVGARINGRLVPLRHEVHNGDTVEVVTQPSAHPAESWLTIVKTSRARQKIRHWLKEQRREDSIALGREMLARELKRLRRPVHPDRELVNVAQSFGIESGEGLLAALGQGDLSVMSVVQRLHPDLREEPTPRKSPFTRLKEMAQRSPEGIQIQGMGNLMIRLAKCCQPVPGEQIVGMVTRGRGLSVHRVDCPNVFEDRVPAERRVELSWDVPDTRAFVVKLLVFGDDRKGMLADLAQAVAEAGTNIVNADIRAVDGDARGTFLVEVNNLSHLQHVIKAMGRVKGVRAVERAMSGGGE